MIKTHIIKKDKEPVAVILDYREYVRLKGIAGSRRRDEEIENEKTLRNPLIAETLYKSKEIGSLGQARGIKIHTLNMNNNHIHRLIIS
jgi:hypothetical protein